MTQKQTQEELCQVVIQVQRLIGADKGKEAIDVISRILTGPNIDPIIAATLVNEIAEALKEEADDREEELLAIFPNGVDNWRKLLETPDTLEEKAEEEEKGDQSKKSVSAMLDDISNELDELISEIDDVKQAEGLKTATKKSAPRSL